MSAGFSTSLRNAQLQAIIDAIDAGSGVGKLKIYDGSRPAAGGGITSQVLLATPVFSDPCASAPSSGALTFNSITSDTDAAADGDASWARITDSDDTFVMDVSVGATGSGADIELTDVSIAMHGTVAVGTLTITGSNA